MNRNTLLSTCREPKTVSRIALLALLIPLAASIPLRANTILFLQGAFAADDQLQLLPVSLPVAGVLTVQTFSYAGGTDALGHLVTAGGFDPVLSLFDGAGNFMTANNDAACGTVGTDPLTLNCFDAVLSLTLTAGNYTLVLSQNDNLAVGPTLADSFTQVGNGNFSCPEFLGVAGGFCDASPSQRNSAWALDIVTPGSASPAPEPAPALLLVCGAALIAVGKYSSVNRRKS